MNRNGFKRTTVAALVAALATLVAAGGRDTTGAEAAAGVPEPNFVPGEVVVRFEGEALPETVALPAEVGVREATRTLNGNPAIDYAEPNFIATASVWPNDPGTVPPKSGRRGDWIKKQWNFRPYEGNGITSPGGIDAVGAWRNLRSAGNPGARATIVAILDTGVAYRSLGERFRPNPDLERSRIVGGYDFVGKDDIPLDHNGHGTHVAGTIAENTHNRTALTGLAYGAKIMPIRVLNAAGRGNADDIAKGIRWAAHHGADVLNLSFNFSCGSEMRSVAEAMRFASKQGAVLVASVGNGPPRDCVTMPATGNEVISVGGTTERGCLADYTRFGPEVDVVAPGGGSNDVAAGCLPGSGRPIIQLTLKPGSTKRFGYPRFYFGTSQAAAHVSGVAAMVIGSRVLGREPTPPAVEQRIKNTARDMGAKGRDDLYGRGLIDADAATRRG